MSETKTFRLSDGVGFGVHVVVFDTPHRAEVIFQVRSDGEPLFHIAEEVFDKSQEMDYNSAVYKAASQLWGKIGFINTQLKIILDK